MLPYHRISQSFDLPLPPHQSVIWLAHCPPHHQSELALALVLDIEHYHITASVSHLTCPLHHISQSFDLPTATTSVNHLTCPLPLYHCIATLLHWSIIWIVPTYPLPPHHCNTALPHRSVIWLAPATISVSHLTCPLPQHQSVIWLSHCHHTSQSFDLPSTTALLHHHITTLPHQ